jgi:hypothetical protein
MSRSLSHFVQDGAATLLIGLLGAEQLANQLQQGVRHGGHSRPFALFLDNTIIPRPGEN